jgi:hypothetical protein
MWALLLSAILSMGAANAAVTFNGVSGEIFPTGTLSELKNVAGATLSARVKLSALPASGISWKVVVFNNGTTAESTRLNLLVTNTGTNTNIGMQGRALDADVISGLNGSAVNLATGTWYHLVVTCQFTTRTAALYVDGVLDTTSTLPNMTTGNTSNTNSLTAAIGGPQDGVQANNWLNGLIEDVQVYNRALSANEILNTKKERTSSAIGIFGAVGLFPLMDASGNLANGSAHDISSLQKATVIGGTGLAFTVGQLRGL